MHFSFSECHQTSAKPKLRKNERKAKSILFLYCIPHHVTIKTVTLLLIWQKPCEYVLPNQIQTFMKRTAYNWIIATVFGAATLFSCHTQTALQDKKPQAKIMGHKQNHELAHIPLPPDYNDPNMWTIRDNDQEGTGADVFYVVSTWEQDWMTNDSTSTDGHRDQWGGRLHGAGQPILRTILPAHDHRRMDHAERGHHPPPHAHLHGRCMQCFRPFHPATGPQPTTHHRRIQSRRASCCGAAETHE